MTIGPMPEWWEKAEPYFIYDSDDLKISDDAPEELKNKFYKWTGDMDRYYEKDRKLEIVRMANSAGYDYAISTGYWEDYEVYEPIYWRDGIFYEGFPIFILAKDTEIRFPNDEEELHKIMEEMEKYSSHELENAPIELEPNLTIKSFKFERGGYVGNYQLFEYKLSKKGKILTYTEKGKYEPAVEPAKVKIVDEKFDEYALGMIKYFHEDFGERPGVCDGEWYEFKATLSNGQKLKSSGYNYFPYTYIKFIYYLEHYWDDLNNIIEFLPLERIENYY